MPLVLALISALAISLVSLLGVITLGWTSAKVHHFMLGVIPFAAGTMLASAFLELLPEASSMLPVAQIFPLLLLSFLGFFGLEKVLHWRHCHDDDCQVHPFGYLNLIGDGIHNFLDGIILAAAFMASPVVGLTTTVAVFAHEIPQEIGDFGVLLHAGFSRKQAVIFNFLSALLSIIGVVFGFILTAHLTNVTPYLLVVAAGGFMYVAATDLIPEMRQNNSRKQLVLASFLLLLGVGLVGVVHLFE